MSAKVMRKKSVDPKLITPKLRRLVNLINAEIPVTVEKVTSFKPKSKRANTFASKFRQRGEV